MSQKKRWVLLRHVKAPDDVLGIHFDLLLEDGEGCRTWRLNELPIQDKNEVHAQRVATHKLEWLEKVESEVSGGRGWATRLARGTFLGNLPSCEDDPVHVNLYGEDIHGILKISRGICRIFSFGKKSI
tara:strand:- start:94 stop:477 length:384 start_codon:yes stop_codon:yes gene_type:complete